MHEPASVREPGLDPGGATPPPLDGIRIGFCVTGSFCTFARVFPQIERLRDAGADIIPILSYHVNTLNTRFFTADEVKSRLRDITGNAPLTSLPEVEPIGPKRLTDLMIVAPCTGNTLGKLAGGITDTPVTMAVKSHLRNRRPVLIAISTNDGLAASARAIAQLMSVKGVYLLPFGQDDPLGKPCSLVADMELIPEGAAYALSGRTLQPQLRQYHHLA